jgi:response regulator of citrate/malate metabolism
MRTRTILSAAVATLVMTLAFMPAQSRSETGNERAVDHWIVGVWSAQLQPDKKKIKKMLKQKGVPFFIRPKASKQVAEKLSNTVMTMRFYADGRFQMEQSSGKNTAALNDRENVKNRFWKITQETSNQLVVILLSESGDAESGPPSTGSTSASKDAVTKYQFYFVDQNRLISEPGDWQDAPFAAPTFTRPLKIRQYFLNNLDQPTEPREPTGQPHARGKTSTYPLIIK